MNIKLMKMLDAVIGRIASIVMPAQKMAGFPAEINSILIIRPGGIGDAVLLVPAINALAVKYPHAKISVLAERRNAAAFDLCPAVADVMLYDHPAGLVKVFQERFDVIIDTEQWYRLSAVVARFLAAPVKIGFATNERRRMFTHQVTYSHDDYEADSFMHLLAPLSIISSECISVERPFLSIKADVSAKTSELLDSLHGAPFITVFPGSSIPERRWGADRFREVSEALSRFGIKTVVVGGKVDYQQGEVVSGGKSGLNFAGLTSLAESAAIIQKSLLLVSGDSGVLHIAVGLNIPTVSLFGPGRGKKWAPRSEKNLVINKELLCSPCTTFGNTPPCPINAQCMRDITVDEVVNSVTMLLTSVGSMPSRCCKREWLEITE